MNKKVFSNKFNTIISITAIVLMLIMVVSVFVTIGRLETTKTLKNREWEIATIDINTGKEVESKQHLVTKEYLKIEDFDVTLDEDATITYSLFFYTEEKNFMSYQSNLTAQELDKTLLVDGAKYVRVEITPQTVDSEPVEINAFNKVKYTGQIKVVYGK